jgi:hypothetical protein
LRGLFAAHAAVRRWLSASPSAEIEKREFPGDIPSRFLGCPFEYVTRAQPSAETDPELIVFTTLFSNYLDSKRISMVLEHHGYPRRWVLFVARHLMLDSGESLNILWRLAQHASTPTRALEAMAALGPGITIIDVSVLRNPNVTRAIVEQIAGLDYSDPYVLGHPLLPVDELRSRFAALDRADLKRTKETLKAVARHPRCPLDIVTELALHPDLFIRAVVACRPDLPPSVRQILAQDESPRVRATLAGLPWPPPKPPREPVVPIDA